jgi:iron complex outermembrane recepter protein
MKTRMISMICGLAMTIPLATFSQNSIRGYVYSQENGESVPWVKLRLEGLQFGAISDDNGFYSIKNVPDGEYNIVVTSLGYDTIRELIVVKQKTLDLNFELIKEKGYVLSNCPPMLAEGIRASMKTPTTNSTIYFKTIEEMNTGKDLPYLFQFLPATVVTSDAGAGVGYTGVRIRGVDPTRTNVTINGIPINDSESHGTFWVNMPDFSSSVNSIQVQRGVGTSSNGASAFGASINIKTDDLKEKPYATIDNGYGSFNTLRHTVKAGTGLINEKFTVDARLSKITSEGYVDRASSDLKSLYLSGAWIGKNSTVRANIFSGKEKTYQAWYGTPESVINGSAEEITAYADRNWIFGDDRDNLLNSGRTYNYYTYENEVDNYQQDHYQLHFSHRFNKKLNLNLAGHYTRGRGYYEQYRADDDITSYGFDPVVMIGANDTITTTTSDLIRRRWLDNHFYGGIFLLKYINENFDLSWGGGANQYNGAHFGEVIWAEFASNGNIRDRYYDNEGNKFEAQSYLKATLEREWITYFADLQFRYIDYSFLGIDDVSGSIEEVDQTVSYNFLNPKAGLVIRPNSKNRFYVSFAVANREPVRSDFRENTPENRPLNEELYDTELGYKFSSRKISVNATAYYMYYINQLVLTGQINDVGGYTRTNVDKSYRTGLEIAAEYNPFSKLTIDANVSMSQNKVASFNEFVDNYDVGGQDTVTHSNTDLAFSPNIIASLGIRVKPVKGLEVSLMSKYVGDQFLDNTSTDSRKLDAYFFSNLEIRYTLFNVLFKEITFGVSVNNLFNEMYENNGYTWGYIAGGERTVENFYYPQAGRHFLTRLTLKL